MNRDAMTGQSESMLRKGIYRGAINTILLNVFLIAVWAFTAMIGHQDTELAPDSKTFVTLLLGLFGLLDLLFIVRAIGHLRQPESHPVYAGLLKRLGVTLEELSCRVSAELARCDPGSVFAGLHILPSWLY